jgi:hypothetical protein
MERQLKHTPALMYRNYFIKTSAYRNPTGTGQYTSNHPYGMEQSHAYRKQQQRYAQMKTGSRRKSDFNKSHQQKADTFTEIVLIKDLR